MSFGRVCHRSRDRCNRGFVENTVSTGTMFFQEREIGDTARDEGNRRFRKEWRDSLPLTGTQVVNNHDFVMLPDQFLNNMRTNKPCAARYNILHVAPTTQKPK